MPEHATSLIATGARRPRRGLALAGMVLLCLAVGATASLFSIREIPTWYAGLTKPSFNPPNWVFAPVWTTLYLLMAVAAWLVWQQVPQQAEAWDANPGETRRSDALRAFWLQLVLNFAWTPVFFRLHQLLAAAMVLVVLWLAIAVTMALFARISRVAALLLAPYLAWVTFAGVLNLALVHLN